MASAVPEFISVLRNIRDTIFPSIQSSEVNVTQKHNNVELMEQTVKTIQADVLAKHDSIKSITIATPVTSIPNKEDGSAGDPAVVYDTISNKFAFSIPAGEKGDPMRLDHQVDMISQLYTIPVWNGTTGVKSGDIAFVNENSSQYVKLNTGTNTGSSDWSTGILITPATKFTELTDAPSTYVGQAGKVATVSTLENSLVFKTGAELGLASAVNLGIHTATLKSAPSDADEFGYLNSIGGAWTLVKTPFSNFMASIISRFGALLATTSTKTTLADTDIIPLGDSANSNATAKVSWGDMKTNLAGAIIDIPTIVHGSDSKGIPVDSDELALVDSATGFNLKKLTWYNLKATAKTYFDTIYAPKVNATLTGTVSLPSTTSIGGVSSAEISYLDNVSSNIQTQLNSKQAIITGGATTIDTENLTASMAMVSDASGKVAVHGTVSAIELGYLDGVTSAIQTQLTAKAPLVSPAFTTGATIDGNNIATENYVASLGLSQMVSGTAVNVSGTAVDFTGIPSWVKKISVMFYMVSSSGTSAMIIQLGDSGGFETTGYIGDTFSSVTDVWANGIIVNTSVAATDQLRGMIVLGRIDSTKWAVFGNVEGGATYNLSIAGVKELSGVLDRIRLTTENGTDTFDGGTVNIIYEG